MGRETSPPKIIDGVTYWVTQLGAKESRRIQLRFARLTGGLLPLAMQGVQGVAGAALVATQIASVMSDEDMELVIDALARGTDFSTEPGKRLPLAEHYDSHFAGRSVAHGKWLAFALEFNYSDFFAELQRLKAEPAPAQ